jgi:hypothetical protein
MKPRLPGVSDHGSEIGLLGFIALGIFAAMCIGIWRKPDAFDPSAYLVVLTLIVGAIKERWTQRSVDRMGQSLANSPPAEPPAKEPGT